MSAKHRLDAVFNINPSVLNQISRSSWQNIHFLP